MKIEVGSQEWLEARRKCVTATDAAIVMLLSPWKTPMQLYNSKINGTETVKSPAMQRGIDLEPFARVAFENMTGHLVYPEFRKHRAIEWMAASFDGINDDGVIVEIKCPMGKDHDLALCGQIPEKYMPQLQHQMYVAEVGQCYYFSYNPDASCQEAIIRVAADRDFQQRMLKAEQEFAYCLQHKCAPEATERDVVQKEDRSWLMKEEELFEVIMKRKELKEKEEALRKEMIGMCEGRPAQGYRLKFNPIPTKGHVDYSRIGVLKEIDLDWYRNPPTTKWRVDPV